MTREDHYAAFIRYRDRGLKKRAREAVTAFVRSFGSFDEKRR